MCGIAGEFDPTPRPVTPINRETIVRMRDALVHRGPDDAGIHIEPHVGLGHRRLSIIDVAGGLQPVFNEDQSVCVVFNGEIYNFRELTQELVAQGHLFSTHSDSEVIVHAWEQWGKDCVKRFRGMFAFALWDRNTRTFFMARDRLGVKPLYYSLLKDNRLIFASELKGIKQRADFEGSVDPYAIEDYFAFGYVPDPKTIYSNVHKLPPGQTLTLQVGEKTPHLETYWDVDFGTKSTSSFSEATDQLIALLDEAVSMRMISEVPLGAFLSGGVDSGGVVALMAGHSPGPVTTCSIGFDEKAFDESDAARLVASRYQTNHHERQVSIDDFDIAARVAALYDEPFADSSSIPTFRVCEMARQHVTVALSGDGGDELFGGYRRYGLHLAEERVRSLLPAKLRATLFGPLGEAFPKLDSLPRPFRAKTTIQSLARSSVAAYCHSMSITTEADRQKLYTSQFRQSLGGYGALEVFKRHAENHEFRDPLSLVQYLDYKTYLPGDINTKVDRASMANSLEVRDPLMDHRLIEWVNTLPSDYKNGSRGSKIIFKSALEKLLPDDILHRRKMGFAVPIAKWFRGANGQKLIDRLASGPVIESNILDKEVFVRFGREHVEGKRHRSPLLWSVFCLDQFLTKG
ncbi:MAG: XrtA/PEP-CTERM system amidotransferase [Burkholderiaceae bacterium]